MYESGPQGASTPGGLPTTWLEVNGMAERTCNVTNCTRPVHSHDMCSMHVKRWQRTGSPDTTRSGRTVDPDAKCRVEGCARRYAAKGYCGLHYSRVVRHGDPGPVGQIKASPTPRQPRPAIPDHWLIGRNGRAYAPPAERFWSKAVEAPSGCWLWTAALDRDGYGAWSPHKGQRMPAHRWSYEQMIGPIPDGLELDHLCRNAPCVNPYHLDPVTTQVNNARRAAST